MAFPALGKVFDLGAQYDQANEARVGCLLNAIDRSFAHRKLTQSDVLFQHFRFSIRRCENKDHGNANTGRLAA